MAIVELTEEGRTYYATIRSDKSFIIEDAEGRRCLPPADVAAFLLRVLLLKGT